jgi:ABC-2 type transport system ATP-binding protein
MTTTMTEPIKSVSYAAPSPVVVRELRKRYGALTAVAGVSFEVRRGEVFGLLGPNGAGKTTTVEILEGLRARDGGEVLVCGFDPATATSEVKERIGVAMQATALPDKICVREALHLFGSFYRQRADTNQLLKMVSLEEKAASRFETLSGGQKQRLAVALALVNDPEVIILDEPTTGLDPQARRELHNVIDTLRQANKTVILTTHYIEEAEKLCDCVAIIDHGQIIATGSPQELINRSRDQIKIEFRTAKAVALVELRQVPFVSTVAESLGIYELRSADGTRSVIELIKWLEAEKHQLVDLHITRPTLEDVFIELTGRRIRE